MHVEKDVNKNFLEVGIELDIREQFNLVADEYDKNRKFFVPCFDDFYINSTKIISSNISYPKRIIDLGAGTGLLTYFWYQNFPDAEFVLVDIADEMLNIARKRFYNISNVSYQIMDYKNNFPNGNFDTIISALSIHHVSDSEKQELFYKIYEILPDNGLFVNYDQFRAEQSQINNWYNSYWENQLNCSGLTKNDIKSWKERKKLDKECSVQQELNMLKNCNFKIVECIYIYYKFAVIFAIK